MRLGSSQGGSPVQATPHVLHAWNAHECRFKLVRTARRDAVSRYMSLSVVRNSRACWTSTYRKVQHTVQYMYISLRTAQWFTMLLLLHSLPALTLTLHPHLFLQPQYCTYACTSVGKVTSAAFSFPGCLRLIVLISAFLAPALLFYLFPFLPAFLLHFRRADVRLPSLLPHSYRTLSAASASRERRAPSNRNRRVAPLRLRHRQNQTSRHLDISPLILPPATLVPEYPYAPPTTLCPSTPGLPTSKPFLALLLLSASARSDSRKHVFSGGLAASASVYRFLAHCCCRCCASAQSPDRRTH